MFWNILSCSSKWNVDTKNKVGNDAHIGSKERNKQTNYYTRIKDHKERELMSY